MRRSLTDLHTHILPQMDDGAQSLEISCAMLRKEKQSGVDRVMLTPHFYPLRETYEAFLQRRQQAWERLQQVWDSESMPQLQLGAEVRYSAALADMDLAPLTLGGSEYLLLELSDQRLPAHLYEVADRLLMRGITVVLAHVERCTYFREEPDRLLKLAEFGVLAQVSAGALQDKKDQGFAKACLKKGLAQMVSSDAHNLTDRPPCLATVNIDDQAEQIAQAIWEHQRVPDFATGPIRKTLFGYK